MTLTVWSSSRYTFPLPEGHRFPVAKYAMLRDVVIAEGPTYPGAVPVFLSYQAEVVQVEMDSSGMRVDLLEETLARLDREGRRPKFIYTVPTFQNPAGVTMSSM